MLLLNHQPHHILIPRYRISDRFLVLDLKGWIRIVNLDDQSGLPTGVPSTVGDRSVIGQSSFIASLSFSRNLRPSDSTCLP